MRHSELIEALRDYKQADEEGVMVLVSRQACEEAAALIEDYDNEDEAEARESPCSAIARRHGCTCRMESVNSASIDPPEPIIDQWCPVHGGRDPDVEYEQQPEDARMALPEHDDPF